MVSPSTIRPPDEHRAENSAPAISPEYVSSVVPAGTLHGDEKVLVLAKPSLWFIVITSLRFNIITILLGELAVKLLTPEVASRKQMALLTVLLVIGRLIWSLLVWTSHIYMLTDQRIITIKGVLNVALFQCTLRKIQRTTLYRPFYQRLFGIGTIGFATAATTDFDSTWVMIPRPAETHEQVVAAIHRVQR